MATRSCAASGKVGTCAAGIETCSSIGAWGPCSVQPAATYRCTYGNDDLCSGMPVPNSQCACGGFVMPTPPSSGLPNPVSYNMTNTYDITDNVTGLMWERNVPTAPAGCSGPGGACTQAEAAAYCTATSTGGRSDWRLPTVLELSSIVDPTVKQPAIDSVAFPNTPSALFWTSTPLADRPGNFWTVSFTTGGLIEVSGGIEPNFVRCVR